SILDSLAPLGFDVKGSPRVARDEILDVCCGSGMISEYYARAGAKVTGCDLDKESIERAAKRAERYGFAADFQTADATALPFGDKTFDIVSAHDGLHHIPSWQKAIAEMCRVASGAIVIVEPAKSFLTSIAVAAGFSLKYEGTDFVYRFAAGELSGILKSSGFENVRVKRYIMYYPHKPGFVFGKLSSPLLMPVVKSAFNAVNFLFGRWGNKIQVIATK
ncbi:MAG: class I SAM-dependent methyltransferase, partial [Endomicrobiia bacterium]|nr:class I SAM-dependent methyltransferase [Endomicrobiia bacterium]